MTETEEQNQNSDIKIIENSSKSPNSPNYKLRYKLKNVHGVNSLTSSIKFSPNGRFFATCSTDKTIKIWLTDSGKLFRILKGHQKGISDICWSPNNRYIVSSSDDLTIRIWNLEFGITAAQILSDALHGRWAGWRTRAGRLAGHRGRFLAADWSACSLSLCLHRE